jgi:uncharacterized protein (DUF2235 family)
MPKKLIVCCDGTGNEINENISNVLKFYRVLRKSGKGGIQQVVYYHPGVGTLAKPNAWMRRWQDVKRIFQLATGTGLEEHVLSAYEFLVQNYRDGDGIFLFGFSRGAQTARVLAAMIHKVGLLYPQQSNLISAAFEAYKNSPEAGSEAIQTRDDKATQLARIASTRWPNIQFLGVWDTVASLITPTSKFWPPFSLEILPYTRRNPSVWAFRQAAAIDERRRMFRLEPWAEEQNCTSNRFSLTNNSRPQDSKQVWFAGVHADVGGGYPEKESVISKYPLLWMIEEAKKFGLQFNQAAINHLVWGVPRKGSPFTYVEPSTTELPHNSLLGLWRALEYFPKSNKYKEWKSKPSILGHYLPLKEPRLILDGVLISQSADELRKMNSKYQPINCPKDFILWPLPKKPKGRSREVIIAP